MTMQYEGHVTQSQHDEAIDQVHRYYKRQFENHIVLGETENKITYVLNVLSRNQYRTIVFLPNYAG